MQLETTLFKRFLAWLDPEPYHHFRCFGCKSDVIVPDRFHDRAKRDGCDWCGETLIPHDQSTGVCCPGSDCSAELLSQGEPDRSDRDERVYAYSCDYCLTESVWAFGVAPCAIRIERDPEDVPTRCSD